MQVRDLLNPAGNKKGGLKVRQHPSKGFYGIKKKNQPPYLITMVSAILIRQRSNVSMVM